MRSVLASVGLGAARLGVVGLSVVVAACSTTDERRYAGAYQPAVSQTVAERPWTVEIEADGKPAQVPPLRRMHPDEDDPTQPWSPNYGRADSVPAAPAPRTMPPPIVHPTWPRPIDAAVRIGPAYVSASRRLSEDEAEAVMARAITAHERRVP